METELRRAASYLQQYVSGLSLGTSIPETELQPADDLVVLAAQAWVSAWKISGLCSYRFQVFHLVKLGVLTIVCLK